MNKFIFDLDNTLYGIGDNIDIRGTNRDFYQSLVPKPFLQYLLNSLNEEYYIFTNGTKIHAVLVLFKLGLNKFFPESRIISRDDFGVLKPSPHGYDLCMRNFNISQEDTVYFFEDMAINLRTAKMFGWKTILINPMSINNAIIDYSFTHIESALTYFLTQKKLTMRQF
tara:strand:+ start:587 stop:1090 length:504 start_codon:yes stop_codon:yes gene_type:complete